MIVQLPVEGPIEFDIDDVHEISVTREVSFDIIGNDLVSGNNYVMGYQFWEPIARLVVTSKYRADMTHRDDHIIDVKISLYRAMEIASEIKLEQEAREVEKALERMNRREMGRLRMEQTPIALHHTAVVSKPGDDRFKIHMPRRFGGPSKKGYW